MNVSENITQPAGSDTGSDLLIEVDTETTDVSLKSGSEAMDPDGADVVNQEITIEFPEFTDLSEYNQFNPFPVYVVEEVLPEAVGFALTNTYPGTISDTYLDYFEGIVQKLDYNQHYVIWRSGNYSYTLAYGDNLVLDGTSFSGDCNIVQIYRESDSYNSTWYVSNYTDSVGIDASSLFVYSDLGMYSTVERGLSVIEANTIIFAVGVYMVFELLHHFFDYIRDRIFRS